MLIGFERKNIAFHWLTGPTNHNLINFKNCVYSCFIFLWGCTALFSKLFWNNLYIFLKWFDWLRGCILSTLSINLNKAAHPSLSIHTLDRLQSGISKSGKRTDNSNQYLSPGVIREDYLWVNEKIAESVGRKEVRVKPWIE